jgi:uncharacterized protein (TIGR02145 family)
MKTTLLTFATLSLMAFGIHQGTNKTEIQPTSVTDTNRNTFKTVTIGEQTWMAENLNVDKFKNGVPIPEAKTREEWEKFGKEGNPAFCYYDFDAANGKIYGKLYNWFAVNDPRGIAPEGFVVASDQDWMKLMETVKSSGQGIALDLRTKEGWEFGKSGGVSTDVFGFSSPASGSISSEGSFKNKSNSAYFWTSVEDPIKEGERTTKDGKTVKFKNDNAYYQYQNTTTNSFSHGSWSKKNGLSVRCVKK